MPRDYRGHLHAGAVGLFDDADEIAAAEVRLEGRAALAESKARKRRNKEQRKIEERKHKQYGERKLWNSIAGMFGRGKNHGEVLVGEKEEGALLKSAREDKAGEKTEREEKKGRERVERVEMFEAWEVDRELDSPFYEELGLVRIRGGKGRDVRIVHRSQVKAPDAGALDDYGE